MNITIFGATGMVGKQLVTHCLAKGYNVRAFGRNVIRLIDADLRQENFEAMQGYIFNETDVQKALEGADAVLSALGGALDGTDKTRSLGMKNIVAQMAAFGPKRIIALGSVGALHGANDSYLMDGPDYPIEYLPVGHEHVAAYECLKASALDWTFVCSPDILPRDADGKFEVLAEAPAVNAQVNAGNLALFMVNELENNKFIKQRVGIGNLDLQG